MVRRAAAAMIILALLTSLVPFHQVSARGDSVLRALLVGSDRFVTHPDTQPAARNNIINLTGAGVLNITTDTDISLNIANALTGVGATDGNRYRPANARAPPLS